MFIVCDVPVRALLCFTKLVRITSFIYLGFGD